MSQSDVRDAKVMYIYLLHTAQAGFAIPSYINWRYKCKYLECCYYKGNIFGHLSSEGRLLFAEGANILLSRFRYVQSYNHRTCRRSWKQCSINRDIVTFWISLCRWRYQRFHMTQCGYLRGRSWRNHGFTLNIYTWISTAVNYLCNKQTRVVKRKKSMQISMRRFFAYRSAYVSG